MMDGKDVYNMYCKFQLEVNNFVCAPWENLAPKYKAVWEKMGDNLRLKPIYRKDL
jgi:hypothetical protein